MSLAKYAGASASAIASSTQSAGVVDVFQVKSVWIGDTKVTTLTILERRGENFRATFECPTWSREIVGTIKSGKVSWLAKDVRVTKGKFGPGGDNHGTISGDTIDFVWRQDNGISGTFSLHRRP